MPAIVSDSFAPFVTVAHDRNRYQKSDAKDSIDHSKFRDKFQFADQPRHDQSDHRSDHTDLKLFD